jgi:hypothetical protein
VYIKLKIEKENDIISFLLTCLQFAYAGSSIIILLIMLRPETLQRLLSKAAKYYKKLKTNTKIEINK